MNEIKNALSVVNDYAKSVKMSSESPIDPIYNWTDAVNELSSLYAAKEVVSKLPPSARRESTLNLIETYLSNPSFDDTEIPSLKIELVDQKHQNQQLRSSNDKLKQRLAELPRQFDDDKKYFLDFCHSLKSLTSERRVKKEDVMSLALTLENFVEQFHS